MRRYNAMKAELKLSSNDPNLIDRKALPTDLQATYDQIAAFLNGVKTLGNVMPQMV